MSKILAVADIHIHAYPNRNPENDYRLYQGSRVVVENIIKAGKENGCDYIVLAGDIVEKSIIRPYVQAEVKYFLDRLMSEFKGGWIIYGNHDQDSKSDDQKIEDSVLGVILPPNLIYAHQMQLEMEGTKIGFSNWQPNFDLSWIQGKLDVLFTHATISYSNSDMIHSQELDESKFDLAICGDIHKPGQIGKYVSIGIPQRCKMSDGEECTGVIFDVPTKTWSYVNLNPSDNLMKFEYTTEIEREGWDKDKHTWYIYRQDPTKNVINAKTTTEAWEEIGKLIESSIKTNDLVGVHSEVLRNIKNIDAGEIDFNFTLTKFYCKNWRSIDECTLYFQDGDKILLQGSNGSGKSSLLSAIKYAFVDVSDTKGLTSLKPFIQFGTKECVTEVEFLYQGSECKIRRGTATNDFGLWINGEQQKYNNKKAFEADVRTKFPFILYMDTFFLDPDHNQLIGGMSVEKKSLIVSKFLKLDRIDTFHDTAEVMQDNIKKDKNAITSHIQEASRIIEYVKEKLINLILPNESKELLLQKQQEGIILQKKSQEWNNFLTLSANYQAIIDTGVKKLQDLMEKLKNKRNSDTIDFEISGLKNKINEIQQYMVELGNIKTKLSYKQKEIDDLKNEGNNAWREAQSIGLGKTCSLCGQIIKTSDVLQRHKEELLEKVEMLKKKKQVLDKELAELEEQWNNSENIWKQGQQEIERLNTQISSLLSEKTYWNGLEQELISTRHAIDEAKNKLRGLGAPEKVELPDNFIEAMNYISSGINTWQTYENLERDKQQAELEIGQYQDRVNVLDQQIQALDKYINVTGPTGVIYQEILNRLAQQFSDTTVNYIVKKYTNRGDHLNLESQYNNNGNWVDYGACSSGQKTVLDIHFLQKIVSRLGLLVMDEFLKHLDGNNHDICLDMINGMNIGCIMISSHMESIAAFNNHTIKLELNNAGLTKINYE